MIAGSGRTIVGIGLGGSDREFALVGMDGWDRRKVVPEYVDIMRRLWRGEDVSYEGQFFSFENVCVRPAPSTVPPIWYAGMSPAAVRRAVLFGDGWMPSHTPMRVLHERVRLLRELSDGEGRSAPLIAPIAYVVPEMAGVQLDGMRLLNEANYRYGQSGETPFRTLRDLAGMLITGTDEEIVRGVRELEDAGASCVIFDLRLVFSRLLPVLDYLGERVLPLLKQ
jgi:alkanesulfonate monooxygenase SsuD/methylene tetrahydromethanopterin reductase-like flavin-dependent oxidoreductase (luciferase family)